MGAKAVDLLLAGGRNQMVAYSDNKITTSEIKDVLTSEKKVDKDMYDLAGILSI